MIFNQLNFYKKFIIYVLVVILAYLLQIKTGLFFNNYFNFLLSALLALIFFVNYLEFIFFSLVAIFLINWKTTFSLDLFLFFLILQLFYFLSLKIKWQNWIKFIILFLLGMLIFYGILNYNFILNYPIYVIYDIFISLIFGLVLFYILKSIKYERRK